MKKILSILLSLLLVSTNAFAVSTPTCNDVDTVTMLHANGTDASTTFIDSSLAAHSFTANGNAQLDTAQKQFGTASILFDGTGDFISTPDAAEWDFGTDDFTLDFWVRFNSVAATQSFFSKSTGTGDQRSYNFLWVNTNILRFQISTVGTSFDVVKDFSWTPSTNTWYHVAFIRTSNTVRAFVDGTQVGTDQTVSSAAFEGTSEVGIGTNSVTDQNNFVNGWIDELRFVKGIAIWTTNFTPPTVEYSDTCRPRFTLLES